MIENQALQVPGSVTTFQLRAQDPAGPFGQPMLSLVSGHYPTGPGQVALTPDLARELGLTTGGVWRQGGGAPALNTFAIQQSVAKEWGMTTDGLRSKTRTKNLTVPRQVAMYLMRELLGMQLVEIGSAFGGRDHSTVIHSLERVGEMMREEPSFGQRVAKIQAALESLRN